MDAVSLDLLSRPLSRMLLVARAHIFLLKRNLRNRLQKLFSRLVRKCPLLISPLLCTLSRPPNLAPRPPARSGAQTSRLSHKGMPLSYNRVLVNICGHLESLPIRLGTEGGIPVVQTSLFAPPPNSYLAHSSCGRIVFKDSTSTCLLFLKGFPARLGSQSSECLNLSWEMKDKLETFQDTGML